MKLTEALEQLKDTKAFILQAESNGDFIVVYDGKMYPFWNDGIHALPFERIFEELSADSLAYGSSDLSGFQGAWENVTIYQVRPEF